MTAQTIAVPQRTKAETVEQLAVVEGILTGLGEIKNELKSGLKGAALALWEAEHRKSTERFPGLGQLVTSGGEEPAPVAFVSDPDAWAGWVAQNHPTETVSTITVPTEDLDKVLEALREAGFEDLRAATTVRASYEVGVLRNATLYPDVELHQGARMVRVVDETTRPKTITFVDPPAPDERHVVLDDEVIPGLSWRVPAASALSVSLTVDKDRKAETAEQVVEMWREGATPAVAVAQLAPPPPGSGQIVDGEVVAQPEPDVTAPVEPSLGWLTPAQLADDDLDVPDEEPWFDEDDEPAAPAVPAGEEWRLNPADPYAADPFYGPPLGITDPNPGPQVEVDVETPAEPATDEAQQVAATDPLLATVAAAHAATEPGAPLPGSIEELVAATAARRAATAGKPAAERATDPATVCECGHKAAEHAGKTHTGVCRACASDSIAAAAADKTYRGKPCRKFKTTTSKES